MRIGPDRSHPKWCPLRGNPPKVNLIKKYLIPQIILASWVREHLRAELLSDFEKRRYVVEQNMLRRGLCEDDWQRQLVSGPSPSQRI